MRVAIAIVFVFWLISEIHTNILALIVWIQEVREESAIRKTEAEIAQHEEELLESYLV